MDVNFVKMHFIKRRHDTTSVLYGTVKVERYFAALGGGGAGVQNMAGCENFHCWGMSQTLGRGINALEVWITPWARLR